MRIPVSLGLLAVAGLATAAPYTPTEDSLVLERVAKPATPAGDAVRLKQLRAALADSPEDVSLAVELASHYVDIARSHSDPRLYGYAEAALAPWWSASRPPIDVLYLRAIIRQNRHDFDAALGDLDQLLSRQPRDAKAWFARAVIQLARGEPEAALQSCAPLRRLADNLSATACASSAGSLLGHADASYRALESALARSNPSDAEHRVWALTTLAEIAVRLGRNGDAESHFREAMQAGDRSVYLISAYADFLLDQERPQEVLDLLESQDAVDPVLLRLALAEKALAKETGSRNRRRLAERFRASRARSDETHLAEEARFELHLRRRPERALDLARTNWNTQREPRDARILLEAALAAGKPEAAQAVLDWMQRTRIEDVQLSGLAQRLRVAGP